MRHLMESDVGTRSPLVRPGPLPPRGVVTACGMILDSGEVSRDTFAREVFRRRRTQLAPLPPHCTPDCPTCLRLLLELESKLVRVERERREREKREWDWRRYAEAFLPHPERPVLSPRLLPNRQRLALFGAVLQDQLHEHGLWPWPKWGLVSQHIRDYPAERIQRGLQKARLRS